jgi:hypothetical protein
MYIELNCSLSPLSGKWRRAPFFRALYFRKSLFFMHKCLNRAHNGCDKPLKDMVFFILYPSCAVQLKFNNAQVLWIAKVSFSEIMWITVELWCGGGGEAYIQYISISSQGVGGEQHTHTHTPEPVFLNPYGAQESMPRHQFRQPM